VNRLRVRVERGRRHRRRAGKEHTCLQLVISRRGRHGGRGACVDWRAEVVVGPHVVGKYTHGRRCHDTHESSWRARDQEHVVTIKWRLRCDRADASLGTYASGAASSETHDVRAVSSLVHSACCRGSGPRGSRDGSA
jgi:hypothetical protein